MKLFFKKFKKDRGYTIIETMIAVSLFVVIVTIGTGTLLNANLLHNKSQNMRSIIDNLNFVLEDMSRYIRTGYNYHCITVNGDLAPPNIVQTKSGPNCWGIAFEYQYGDNTDKDGDPVDDNDQWVYFISADGKIYKATEGPYNPLSSSVYVQLTPDEIVINTAASSFSVLGAEPEAAPYLNKQQPFVTIHLVGTITYKNVDTPFSLQTSVSQRLVDI